MFIPIGFFESVSSGSIVSGIYTTTMYKLEEQNYSESSPPYQKNGSQLLGRYERGRNQNGDIWGQTGYTSEILSCISDISTIIGKTIDSFSVTYTVDSEHMLNTTSGFIRLFECTESWSDDGFQTPTFNDFLYGEFNYHYYDPWTNQLALANESYNSLGTTTGPGTYTITSTNELKTLAQRWANGESNNGIIMGMTTQYFDSYLMISNIKFNITYH